MVTASDGVHFESRMNASDATLWRIERDPALRTTILGIALLEGTPEWEALRTRMREMSEAVPRLRQRVAPGPLGLGTPRWVDVDHVDLDYHLRRVVAPAPGDLTTLMDLAAPIVMAAFDRDRPLWEFTLVEGLRDGHSALLQKLHHSATDGVGAMRVAKLLFDPPGDAAADQIAVPVVRRPSAPHPLLPSPELVADRLVHLAFGSFDAARHPVRAAGQLVRTAESIGKLVLPASEPLSPLMRGRGLSRRLATLELPVDALREAGHVVGGTLNDAYLAAIGGGMRRYHLEHGAQVDALRVTMPINLRDADDAVGNNRFTPVRFALPVGHADPLERMREAGRLTASWRKEPGLKYTSTVAGVLANLPEQVTTMVMGGMLKAVDLVATNVPGLEDESLLCGVRVSREIAFAPPSGAALSVALLSHAGHASIGLTIDTTAVPDPDVLARCMADGFQEVAEVGRR